MFGADNYTVLMAHVFNFCYMCRFTCVSLLLLLRTVWAKFCPFTLQAPCCDFELCPDWNSRHHDGCVSPNHVVISLHLASCWSFAHRRMYTVSQITFHCILSKHRFSRELIWVKSRTEASASAAVFRHTLYFVIMICSMIYFQHLWKEL
jgi:hypothetical protein